MDEAGVPGYEASTAFGVLAPARTPRESVIRLNREIAGILHSADIKERLVSQGLDPVGSTPEELDALIKKEIKLYAKLVKDIGFKPM